LHYDNNWRGGERDWRLCFVFDVKLEYGYFGLSAATGGLSDHHDIISFSTHKVGKLPNVIETASSNTPEERKPSGRLSSPVLGASPTEVANRLLVIETKRFEFASSLHERFDKIQDKMNTLEQQSISTLSGLVQSLAGMIEKLRLGEESVSVCKSDLDELNGVLSQLQSKLQSVADQVHGTKYQADQLRQINKLRSAVLSEVIEGHGFGFWLFFALFQAFFCIVAFFYKKDQEERINRKFM